MLPSRCGLMCSEWEYAAAIDASTSVERELVRVWNDIMATENDKQSWAVTTKWEGAFNVWWAEWLELPEPWSLKFFQHTMSFNLGTYFDAAYEIVAQGTCLLDALVTDGQAAHGDAVVSPVKPTEAPDEGWVAGLEKASSAIVGAVVVIAVVGVGFAVFRQVTK